MDDDGNVGDDKDDNDGREDECETKMVEKMSNTMPGDANKVPDTQLM